MNYGKINNIIATLNLTTESMSLYSNVKMSSDFLTVSDANLIQIYRLNTENINVPIITDKKQILNFVPQYIKALEEIQKTLNNLLIYYKSKKNTRNITKEKDALKNKLTSLLNDCYQYKLNTIELHNKSKMK